MIEIWKDVVGYEGLYKVSNYGDVMSLSFRNRMCTKERCLILKHAIDKDGYYRVQLCKNGIAKGYIVHRLVATAFIDNIYALPVINHKDENKKNNYYKNLEWCTVRYNTNYNEGTIKRGLAERLPIVQFTKDMIQIKAWTGRVEITKSLRYSGGNITSCCIGNRKTANGYIWKYLKDIHNLS